MYNIRKKEKRLRFLTDIAQDNILHCKDFMKITELCLDGMDGNFGLVDEKWYYAAASSDETNGISNYILLIPNNS
ncbi:MAG: hypothetical protein WAZ77_08115 [Candidatus Nitrosopolaris sp.]